MNKQVLIYNDDISISKGKATAHAAHATCKTSKKISEASISLKADKKQLEYLIRKAQDKGLEAGSVRDAGRTEVDAGTKIVGFIYGDRSEVDEITGDLSLL